MELSVARMSIALSLALSIAACGGGSSQPGSNVDPGELEFRADAFAGLPIETLRRDPGAMALADELFERHCADCHGSDARGGRGVTDLTLGRFAYGTTPGDIRTTIRDGRVSEMPGMGAQYGEVELGQIVAFVETLSTGDASAGAALSNYERRGREIFIDRCVVCHGEDGRGQPLAGAPDLTDDYWQYGDSMMNLRLAITRGIRSECPSRVGILDPVEIDLLTAWTLELIDS